MGTCLKSVLVNTRTRKRREAVWAVVEAQLVEQSLMIPEVRGSIPVIGKKILILNICLLPTVYRRREAVGSIRYRTNSLVQTALII